MASRGVFLRAAAAGAPLVLRVQARLPAIEYPTDFVIKRITNAGTFRFQHNLLFLSNTLKQLPVGLEEVDDGLWSIYFCNVLLARLDERDYTLRE